METTVTGPDVVTFWWFLDLDDEFGRYDVRLDFNTIESRSEEFGWEPVTVVIPEGEHSLRWSFQNFSNTNARARLDELFFASESPVPLVYNSTELLANAGTLLEFPIEATGDITSYALHEGPEWLSADPDTGIVSGTPPLPMTVSAVLVASNAEGSSER